jgi:hypothetical protein
MEGRRPWTHHLRLLPGGDANIASAVATTITLYVIFGFIGLITGLILVDQFRLSGELEGVGVFSITNAIPCFIIFSWMGLRVRATKPIAVDEAAVDIDRRRVYFGDEVGRVPTASVTFSIRPRQVSATMSDGRPLTVFFRVNGDPEDLIALAREMKSWPDLPVEDYVHSVLVRLTKELLPDPAGLREALADDLLRRGIVITRVETA